MMFKLAKFIFIIFFLNIALSDAAIKLDKVNISNKKNFLMKENSIKTSCEEKKFLIIAKFNKNEMTVLRIDRPKPVDIKTSIKVLTKIINWNENEIEFVVSKKTFVLSKIEKTDTMFFKWTDKGYQFVTKDDKIVTSNCLTTIHQKHKKTPSEEYTERYVNRVKTDPEFRKKELIRCRTLFNHFRLNKGPNSSENVLQYLNCQKAGLPY